MSETLALLSVPMTEVERATRGHEHHDAEPERHSRRCHQ